MTTFETGTDPGGIITAAADADATTPKPLAANEETDFDSMKVAELKVMLRDLGLTEDGKKDVLVDRLQAHWEAQDAAASDAGEAVGDAAAVVTERTTRSSTDRVALAAPVAAASITEQASERAALAKFLQNERAVEDLVGALAL